MERKGVVTFQGNPLTLLGEEVKIGQKAPGFTVLDSDLQEVSLDTFAGKIKLIASVPSLDTPVCDLEIKRFNEEAAKISGEVAILFISMDLPFAQKRFCQSFDITKIKTLSDHKTADFGNKYGVLIKELRLLSRAIFVIDKSDVVSYIECVKEIADQPNYEEALEALKKASA
jgi:thiol peroxidase